MARHQAASNFAFASIQELNTLIPRLAAALEEQGQKLQNTEVTTLDRVFIATSDHAAEEAWKSAGAPVVNGHPGLVGGPDKLVEAINDLEGVGVSSLFCMFQNASALRLFCENVVPHFR